VVDEAGMLDQDAAVALLTITAEAGATIALVGDRAQLPAVGRGGVLDMATQLSTRTFDMATVHRFTNPEYADLTVRMRSGENPALLFDQLRVLGLIKLHESTEAAQEAIAQTALDGETITVATNDEARELNERIRTERVQRGDVDDTRTTTGSDGLAIGAGDVIQTRKNDNKLQVTNRQTWTVQHVGEDGTVWVREAASGHKYQRTLSLPVEYVSEYTHLAYASTAYGVQGATVSESHTVLSDALDAAGVYVGMTRGRTRNRLHIVAADPNEAREQFTSALERDRADRGLVDATRAAHEAVRGLVGDGPVNLVNQERARLAQQIEHADRRAANWECAIDALAQLRDARWAEQERHEEVVSAAASHAAQVHTGVVAPLIEQATIDGTAYLSARERMRETTAARNPSVRLGERAADRAAADATSEYRATEDRARLRWGGLPIGATGVEQWAETVAGTRADTDPRVVEANRDTDQTRSEQQRLAKYHADERAALRRRILGELTPSTAGTRAAQWHVRAERARHDLAEIDAIPTAVAAQLVRDHAARAEAEGAAAERAQAARDARAAKLDQFRSASNEHQRPGPDHGVGPSL